MKMRDKNGRFIKRKGLEIPIPSIFSISKILVLFVIFLPWLYILLYRFEAPKIFEKIFTFLLGNTGNTCVNDENGFKKSPY